MVMDSLPKFEPPVFDLKRLFSLQYNGRSGSSFMENGTKVEHLSPCDSTEWHGIGAKAKEQVSRSEARGSAS